MEYWALERAAKVLRADPARYQPVEGIEYDLTEPALFHWGIHFGDRCHVEGLVGLFPLERLIPHEATTAAVMDRPRYPVQIRPVMALVDEPLPALEPAGESVEFHGIHHHVITPVAPVALDLSQAIIADGHHRVAAALRGGGDPMIMTMVVDSGQADLDAGAFHRYFASEVVLPDTITDCEVVQESPLDAILAGRMAIVTNLGSIGVAVTDQAVPEVLRGLPAGLASRYVFPGLGLDEADAVYLADTRQALAAIEKGGTVVLLPPSWVRSVMRAAIEGVALPPKSTRFRPKPIRGFLMRPDAI